MPPESGVEMSQRPLSSADERAAFSGESERKDRLPSTIFEVNSSGDGTHGSFRQSSDWVNNIVRSRTASGSMPPENGDRHHQDNAMDTSETEHEIWMGPEHGGLTPPQRNNATPPPIETQDSSAEPSMSGKQSIDGRPVKKRRTARLPWYAILFGWNHNGEGSARNYMVHPESPFIVTIHYIQCFLLLYTGLVVPVVLAFLWDQIEVCWRNPLLEFDTFVDTFFLLEIPLNFCVGIHVQGMYTDNPKRVAKKYITERLGFDLLTSIPVSYLELWSLQGCGSPNHEETGPPVSKLRLARLLKPLRIFRVLRVFRALKNLTVLTESYTAIERFLRIHPLALRFLRVILSILAATHLGACSFWWVKVVSNAEADMHGFLDGWNLEYSGDIVKKYIISVYFVCTVFTTVGFGDISGSNAQEQLLCIVLMLVGVMVFGVLLSEVEVGIDELKKMSREKDRTLQQLKNFLRFKEVSSKTERRIIDWVGFQVGVSQMEGLEMESREHLAPAMVAALDSQHFKYYLDNVSLLQFPKLDADARARMRAMLAAQAHALTFQKGTVIVSDQVPAEGLLLIEEGHVRVEDDTGGLVSILRHGQCIGEYSLIGEEDTSLLWGISVIYIAQTHVRCKFISTYDFDMVLDEFPAAREAMVEQQQDLFHQQEMMRRGSTKGRSYFVARARWISIVRAALRKDLKRQQKRGRASKKRRNSVDLNMFTASAQGLIGSTKMGTTRAVLLRQGTVGGENFRRAASNDSWNASAGAGGVWPVAGRGNGPPSDGTAHTHEDEAVGAASAEATPRTTEDLLRATVETLVGTKSSTSTLNPPPNDEEGKHDSEAGAVSREESFHEHREEGMRGHHPWAFKHAHQPRMHGSSELLGIGGGSFAMQHAVKVSGHRGNDSFGHGHRRRPGHNRPGHNSHSDGMHAMHHHGSAGALGGGHDKETQAMLAKLSVKVDNMERKMTHDMDRIKTDLDKIIAALNLGNSDERNRSRRSSRRVSPQDLDRGSGASLTPAASLRGNTTLHASCEHLDNPIYIVHGSDELPPITRRRPSREISSRFSTVNDDDVPVDPRGLSSPVTVNRSSDGSLRNAGIQEI